MLIKLFFQPAAERASQYVGAKPGRAFLRGVLTFTLFFILIVIFGSSPIGPLKLFGFMLLLVGFSLTMLGAVGLVMQLSSRYGQAYGNESLSPRAFFRRIASRVSMAGG